MPKILRFDRFEFDPASGELRAGETVVRLEPQPAKVLALLAARSGEVVTRDQLQQEVWPADVFVDFERGLNYCVRRVRQALGDSPEAPRFIATLPKRGYRFLVAVDPGGRADAGETGEAPPGGQALRAPAITAADAPAVRQGAAARPASRHATLALVLASATLAAVAAVAAAFLGIGRARSGTPPAPAPPAPTVAVTLFDNETGRRDLDRTAQIFTDVLVERLARGAPPWSVIGNAAVLRQPRPFQNLAAIGQSLHAEIVVLGQLLPATNGLTVLAHLIRTRDQRHLWVGRFAVAPEPSPSDIDRIDATVAGALARHTGTPAHRP